PIQLDVLRVCSPPSNSSFTSPQNFSVSEADRGRVSQSPEEERQIQKPETRPPPRPTTAAPWSLLSFSIFKCQNSRCDFGLSLHTTVALQAASLSLRTRG